MNVASYVIRRKKQLTTCLFHVFSLGKCGFQQQVSLQALTSQPNEISFDD
jgi:hypothetical protein